MKVTQTSTLLYMPEKLKEVITEAATKSEVSVNEYIRRTLAEKVDYSYIS